MKTKLSAPGFQPRLALPFALALAIALSGCGTISERRTADGKSKMDLKAFNKVLVRDFEDKASAQEEAAKREEKQAQLKRATRDFADMIASEIRKTGAFEGVSREGTEDPSTLLIGGAITKYERGSSAARLWVGMGAGSSYLDALVEVRQGAAGTSLGSVLVNKNSWAGGGALAAGQTVEGFMEEAAKKIAEELQKAKRGEGAGKM
jgi:uncharacterized protein DUF4410